MASLSQTARADKRRTEILAAARDCFIANGFHATSMQDLLKAANISAGAFYRYFPSKTAVVAAIAETVIDELATTYTKKGEPESVVALVRQMVEAVEMLDNRNGTPRLAVQIWGEAQRVPELSVAISIAFGAIVGWYEERIRALQAAGRHPPGPAREIAAVAAGLVQGFMVQRTCTGLDAARYCEGLAGMFGSE